MAAPAGRVKGEVFVVTAARTLRGRDEICLERATGITAPYGAGLWVGVCR